MEDDDTNWIPFLRSSPEMAHSNSWKCEGFVSPFQSIPQECLDELLDLAEDLTCNDIVFDLGCGDGRFLINCVRRYKCKGVGIELDESLCERALSDILQADLEREIVIHNADFMVEDFSSATIIFMYLIPEALKVLSPRILSLIDRSTKTTPLRCVISFYWDVPVLARFLKTEHKLSVQGNVFSCFVYTFKNDK